MSTDHYDEVKFEERENYLYVFVRGTVDNLELAKNGWEEIATLCNSLGYKKLLIEEEVDTQLSIPDMFSIISALPNMGFLGIKIAFVDKVLEQYASNLFGENVAVNRGIIGKVFKDVDVAEEWLLAEG